LECGVVRGLRKRGEKGTRRKIGREQNPGNGGEQEGKRNLRERAKKGT